MGKKDPPPPPPKPSVCSYCGGSGTIRMQVVGGPNGKEPPQDRQCPVCRGTGKGR